MQRLFLFLYQYRAFLLFVFLEVVSVWLIVNNNQYQGAAFFNSANHVAGNVYQTKQDINSYFDLKDVNHILAEENARLRSHLKRELEFNSDTSDSSVVMPLPFNPVGDFKFQSARVINNSTRRYTNFITLDKGSEDG